MIESYQPESSEVQRMELLRSLARQHYNSPGCSGVVWSVGADWFRTRRIAETLGVRESDVRNAYKIVFGAGWESNDRAAAEGWLADSLRLNYERDEQAGIHRSPEQLSMLSLYSQIALDEFWLSRESMRQRTVRRNQTGD